jgi:hypothetical protein
MSAATPLRRRTSLRAALARGMRSPARGAKGAP